MCMTSSRDSLACRAIYGLLLGLFVVDSELVPVPLLVPPKLFAPPWLVVGSLVMTLLLGALFVMLLLVPRSVPY